MSVHKILPLLVAWAGVVFPANAQHYHNAWFRTTLSYPVNKKISVDGEFQHRRQSGFDNKDCLDEALMYTLRSWVHYRHNESVRFSLSPVAYFSHHRIIQEASDAESSPIKEYRASAAVDLQHKIFGKLFITDRNAVEYRMLGNTDVPVTRMRGRLGLRYDLLPTFKIAAYTERFFNVAGTTTYYFFDHKRNAFTLEYGFSPAIRLETGYIHIVRLPPGNQIKLRENNLFLNLIFQLH